MLELLIRAGDTAETARYVYDDFPVTFLEKRLKRFEDQSWSQNVCLESRQKVLSGEGKREVWYSRLLCGR